MSLNHTTLQPAAPLSAPIAHHQAPSLLAAMVLSVYAAQLSRRKMRRLKRRALWMLAKAQVRSVFRRDTSLSTRTLLYIVLGLLVLILAFTIPVLAIIVLLAAVIYLLATGR